MHMAAVAYPIDHCLCCQVATELLHLGWPHACSLTIALPISRLVSLGMPAASRLICEFNIVHDTYYPQVFAGPRSHLPKEPPTPKSPITTGLENSGGIPARAATILH
jgi:hypothetical protein